MSDAVSVDGVSYVSTIDAAERTARSADYIALLSRQGKVRATQIGRRWYVDLASLNTFLTERHEEEEKRRANLSTQLRAATERSVQLAKSTRVSATTKAASDSHSQFVESLRARALSRAASVAQSTSGQIPLYAVSPSFELLHKVAAAVLALVLVAGLYTAEGSLISTSPQFIPGTNVTPSAELTAASGFLGGTLGQLASAFEKGADAFLAPLYGVHLAQGTSPQGVVAVQVTPLRSSAPVVTSQTVNQTVVENPIVERVVQSERVIASGGITQEELTQQLQQLDNSLTQKISTLTAANSTVVAENYSVTAQSNAIDQLTNTTITDPSISGGSIANAGISGATISDSTFTGTTTLDALVVSGSATSTYGGGIDLAAGCFAINGTCISASGGGSGTPGGSDTQVQFNESGAFNGSSSFTFASSTATLSVLNASTTNATTTNLYVSGEATLANALPVPYGGTGTSTTPSYGQVLVGNSSGGYSLVATSSLGIVSGGGSSNVSTSSQNTWSALQIFAAGASTTNLSVFQNAWFGSTATSSFNSSGQLTLAGISNSLLSTNTNGQVVATTSIGTNLLTGTLGIGNGGTGANSFSYGLVLSPGGTGVLTNIATSSLGLLTTNVVEGTNLYFTNARAVTALTGQNVSIFTNDAGYLTPGTFAPDFDNRLSATTSLPNITTLAGLSLPYSQLTGTPNISGYPFALSGNATSTLTQFNGGLTAFASSTIGNGNQNGGLTINGGATTTGNLLVQGNATTTDFFSTTASSTNLFAQSAALGALSLTRALPIASGGANATSYTSGQLLAFDGTRFVSTSTIGNTQLANSSLTVSAGSGLSGGGSVALGGSTSLSLDLTHGNSWTGLQSFANASSSLFSNIGIAYFGGTATSTFDSAGDLAVAGTLNVTGKSTLSNASTTVLSVSGNSYLGTGQASSFSINSIISCAGSEALQTDGSGNVSCGAIMTGGASAGGGWIAAGGAVNGTVTESTSTYLVAIGATSTPYAKFTVLSGSNATTTLALVPASAQTANILDIYAPGSGLSSVFTAGGSFGIGSTSPSATLSVNGTAYVTGTTTITGPLTFANATTTNFGIAGLANALLSTNANGSVVATTSVGVNYLTGTLPVANGGTGSTTLTGILKGNGTGGVQTALGGTDYEFPLTFSTGLNRTGNTITNTGVLSLGSGYATTTGTSIALSTTTQSFNGLTIAQTITSPNGSDLLFAPNVSGTLNNSGLSNSTISGVALGGNLANLSATNGTLTFSGSYNGSAAQTAGLNLANANNWTGLQTFQNASSSLFSAVTAYFGGTATSTFASSGNLILGGTLTDNNGGTLGGTFSGTPILSGGFASQASSTVVGAFTATGGLTVGNATSTFANGITLNSGCIFYNGSCIGANSGTVNSGNQGQFAFYATNGTTVSGTSTIFVTQADNVGIGTTNPGLTSGASQYLTIASNGANTLPALELSGTSNSVGGTIGRIDFYSQPSADVDARISTVIGNDTSFGSLVFSTGQYGTLSEAARFDQNGNLGIGTTSPGSILSINGVGNFVGGATSTLYNGLNITGGCVSVNGTCLTSNLGTVTSIIAGTGLTGGTITTSGTVALDLTHTNSWTGLQSFANASSTLFSSTGTAYFGGTATSSFNSAGVLTLASALGIGSGGTNATSFTSGQLLSYNGTSFVSTSTIGNNQLANSSVTINTSGPLSGGGSVSLGGSLSLSCPTCTTGGITVLGNYASTTGTAISLSTSTVTTNGQTLGLTVVASANGVLFTPTISGTLNNGGLTNSTITFSSPNSTLSAPGSIAIGSTANFDLNLAHSNWWTATQNFTNASTSQFTATSTVWFTSLGTGAVSSDANGKLSSGTLSIANGGTGTTTAPAGQLIYGGGNSGAYQSVGTSTLSASSPLTGSFTQIGSGGSLGCQTASASQAGCLSLSDWTTFNAKIGVLGNYASTTGSSISLSTSTVTTNGQTHGLTVVASSNGILFTPTISGTLNNAGLTNSTISGVSLGSNLNNLTINSSGSGAASGATYNGSSGVTISYNTVGAQAAGAYLTTLGNYASTTGTAISLSTSTLSFNGLTLGQTIVASTNNLQFTPTVSGTLNNSGLTNSTISGVALGGNLANLSATNGTLTFSSSYNGSAAQTIGLNLANANSWTGLQQFSNASTTLFSAYGPAYFGATATSSFGTNGSLTLNGLGTFASGFVSQASSTVVGNFTTTGSLFVGSTNSPALRQVLTSNRTYYVSTTGSNSNDGLTSGTPFLTIQHAVNVVSQNIDLAGFNVTIQLADGTYNESVALPSYVGILTQAQAAAVIQGNSGNHSAVFINPSSGSAFTAVDTGVGWTLKNLKLASSGGPSVLEADYDSKIYIDGVVFGAGNIDKAALNTGAFIEAINNGYTIASSSAVHDYALDGGEIINQAITITLSGSPNFSSAFAVASTNGVIDYQFTSFSGSATGQRFIVSNSGWIYTGSTAPNTLLPGNGNGTLSLSSSLYADTGTGDIGIGTTGPLSALDVNGGVAIGSFAGSSAAPSNGLAVSGNARFFENTTNDPEGLSDGSTAGTVLRNGYILSAQAGDAAMYLNRNGSDGSIVNFFRSGNSVGSISVTTTATNYGTGSDRRIKQNIEPTTVGLDTLMKIPVDNFDFINDPTHATTTGFIAQDLLPIFPEAVATNGDNGVVPLGLTSTPWTVDYGRITPLIVKAVQDIADISDAFEQNLIAWLGDASNGVHDLYATILHANELCLSDTNGTSCYTRSQLDAAVAAADASQSSGQGSGGTSASTPGSIGDASTTPDSQPVIRINGDNPAIVQVGAVYNDLGATITGPEADLNLGIQTYLNGALTSNIVLNTSQVATDTIDYVATDQSGLTATSTRTVIIEAPQTAQPANDNQATSTPANDNSPPLDATGTDATSSAQ